VAGGKVQAGYKGQRCTLASWRSTRLMGCEWMSLNLHLGFGLRYTLCSGCQRSSHCSLPLSRPTCTPPTPLCMTSPGCQVHAGAVVSCAAGSNGVLQLDRAAPAGDPMCMTSSFLSVNHPARHMQSRKGKFRSTPISMQSTCWVSAEARLQRLPQGRQWPQEP
jgi:hypothetical protein